MGLFREYFLFEIKEMLVRQKNNVEKKKVKSGSFVEIFFGCCLASKEKRKYFKGKINIVFF